LNMMIGKRLLLSASAIAMATALLPGLLRADITIDSHAGLAACMFNAAASACGASGAGYTTPTGSGGTITPNGVTTTGLSVAITPDTLWQPNGPNGDSNAVWIGAVKSGEGDPNFVASNLGNLPVYQITSETFVTGDSGGSLNLDVWADDTTAVFLNGVQIAQLPDPTTDQSTCQGHPISCTPGTQGVATSVALAKDTAYTLTFNVWQTGPGLDTTSNPTGLLYTGSVSGATVQALATPEAGVLSMLLSMLVGIAAIAAIFKKKLA
jgi:hypothetical protein